MILRPQSTRELSDLLASAARNQSRIERVDLSTLSRMVEHAPEDMTASVEAGISLAAFQQELGKAGQWLPIDPPHSHSMTVADLLAYDASGPRRFGYGTIRDFLIGIKVMLADGQAIKAGGKVVKNVAGYDLCKLFIGARHSLGVIFEATFKLRPFPEYESILQTHLNSLDELAAVAGRIIESPVQPVILDAHNLDGSLTLVVGLAGAREDVEYQLEILRPLASLTAASTEYETAFWREPAEKRSVLPSETVRNVQSINPKEFVARLGNGIIYFRPLLPDDSNPDTNIPNRALMDRVKRAYDPKHIFPEYTI
jgi:FAD/FMN-containing dehydrogenase